MNCIIIICTHRCWWESTNTVITITCNSEAGKPATQLTMYIWVTCVRRVSSGRFPFWHSHFNSYTHTPVSTGLHHLHTSGPDTFMHTLEISWFGFVETNWAKKKNVEAAYKTHQPILNTHTCKLKSESVFLCYLPQGIHPILTSTRFVYLYT